MTTKSFIISITGLVIILFYFLVLIQPSEESRGFVRSLDATPELFERSFEVFEQLTTRDLTDTTEVFRPAHVKMYGDKIYVSDFSDFTIYEYDNEGNQTGKIETGRGRGPGEFQNLTDFDLFRDTLWAVDSQNFMISSFSAKTGEYITSFSVDHRPYRITCLEDGFIVKWLGREHLFSKFDYDGNELNRFGQVIDDQMRHVLSLSGAIRSNRKNRFIYIPSYASFVYQYQGDGELINVLKAPDGLEFPVTRREGAVSFAPDFSFYRDAYINEPDELYVYTRLPGERNAQGEWEGDSWSTFDKYDLVNGRYVKSIRLPFMHSAAMFHSEQQTIYSAVGLERSFIHQIEGEIDF